MVHSQHTQSFSPSTSTPPLSKTIPSLFIPQRFMSQPFHVAEVFTGRGGRFVQLEDTIKGFQEILSGKLDSLPEGTPPRQR